MKLLCVPLGREHCPLCLSVLCQPAAGLRCPTLKRMICATTFGQSGISGYCKVPYGFEPPIAPSTYLSSLMLYWAKHTRATRMPHAGHLRQQSRGAAETRGHGVAAVPRRRVKGQWGHRLPIGLGISQDGQVTALQARRVPVSQGHRVSVSRGFGFTGKGSHKGAKGQELRA